MKIIILAFSSLLVMFLCACSDNLEKKVVSVYPNGTPTQVNYLKEINGKAVVVKETRFYPNGEKSSEGEWTPQNQKTGEWTQWFMNGEKWIEENYENGSRDGSFVVWRENGEKEYEGEYKDDMPAGTWKFFDKKGNKQREIKY